MNDNKMLEIYAVILIYHLKMNSMQSFEQIMYLSRTILYSVHEMNIIA